MPIKGPVFKCRTCKQYSLCKRCYKQRAEWHAKDHRFYVAKDAAVVPAADPAPPPPSPGVVQARPSPGDGASRVDSEHGRGDGDGSAKPQALPEARGDSTPPAAGEAAESADPKRMQEMWQNLGKTWDKEKQQTKQRKGKQGKQDKELKGKVQDDADEKKRSSPRKPDRSEKKVVKKDSARPAEVDRPPISNKPAAAGKWLPQGARCSVCKRKAAEDGAGVVCRRRRPDGSDGGCRKGVCWRCMKPTPGDTLGKVRVMRAEFKALGSKAWWMHEVCLTGEDERDYFVMMLPAPT